MNFSSPLRNCTDETPPLPQIFVTVRNKINYPHSLPQVLRNVWMIPTCIFKLTTDVNKEDSLNQKYILLYVKIAIHENFFLKVKHSKSKT